MQKEYLHNSCDQTLLTNIKQIYSVDISRVKKKKKRKGKLKLEIKRTHWGKNLGTTSRKYIIIYENPDFFLLFLNF